MGLQLLFWYHLSHPDFCFSADFRIKWWTKHTVQSTWKQAPPPQRIGITHLLSKLWDLPFWPKALQRPNYRHLLSKYNNRFNWNPFRLQFQVLLWKVYRHTWLYRCPCSQCRWNISFLTCPHEPFRNWPIVTTIRPQAQPTTATTFKPLTHTPACPVPTVLDTNGATV